MNKKILSAFMWLLAAIALGCVIQEKECESENLIGQNTISDECRSKVTETLSPADNNLEDRVVPMGAGTIEGYPVLFMAGSGSDGSPVILSSSEIIVKADQDGELTTLPPHDYLLRNLSDFSDTLISLSSVIDYSGSMRDEDIDDAIEIYTDLLYILPRVFESEIRLFSGSVIRKTDFTSDSEMLLAAIVRDDDFERGATALYDAIGVGLAALSTRDGAIRLLMVATDGQENASTTYMDRTQLYALSRKHDIPVIILGSLLSDLDFMKEIASETNGFYIYNRTLKELKNDTSRLIGILENIQAIEITGSSWTQARAFEVMVNDKSLSFTLD